MTEQQRRDTKASFRAILARRDRLWMRWLARALLPITTLGVAAILMLAGEGVRWSMVTAALLAIVPAALALLSGAPAKESGSAAARMWLAAFVTGLVALGTMDLARDLTAMRRSEACLRLASVAFSKQASGSVTCRYGATQP